MQAPLTTLGVLWLATALLAGIGACGRLAPADATAPDAQPEAAMPKCASGSSFGAPTPLASLNTSTNDSDVRLTPDELVAYFASARGSESGDMFVATRSTIAEPFGTPSKVPGLGAVYAGPESPSITSDQLDLLFFGGVCSSIPDPTAWLCGVSRTSASEPFGAPQVVNVGNSSATPHFAGAPYAVDDGLTLYFNVTNLQGIGIATRATRSDDFGPVTPVGVELEDAGDDFTAIPVVTPDELTLFFVRAVQGGIWVASRTSTDAPFTNARELTEIEGGFPSVSNGGGAGPYPNWISPDGCRLYFTAPLPADDGGDWQTDLYVASRSP